MPQLDKARDTTKLGELPHAPSDAELRQWIERMSAGDATGLERLFEATYAPLCAFAQTFVRSAAAAEDVVGETFLKLWLYRERVRVRGSVRNYLYMAVRNTAINQIQRAARDARYVAGEPPEAERVGERNEAEDRLQMEVLSARAKEAIARLPRRAQQTYVLYYQHEMSYAEVASVMGVSVKTVENQLARALRLLWAELEDLFQ